MLITKSSKFDNVAHFDSIEEFGAWTAQHPEQPYCTDSGGFLGGMSQATAIPACVDGKPELVPNFDVDGLDLTFAETSGWSTRYAIDGHGHVNIGRYIAGAPNCIKTRRRTLVDTAPIKIGIMLTTSGGCSQAEIESRGKMLLTLLRAVGMSRPVEFYAVLELGSAGANHRPGKQNGTASIRMESKPIHLAQAAYVLAHPGFARGVGFRAISAIMGHTCGEWHSDYYSGTKQYPSRLAARIGFTESDVLFGEMHLSDTLARTNPQAWIQREYRRIMGLTEDSQ